MSKNFISKHKRINMYKLLIALSALIFLISLPVHAADVLSVEDLEKVSHLQNLKLVPKDPAKGAGGDLNFADTDNKLVAMIMIQDVSMYDFWEKQFGRNANPVPDLGDKGFQTKPGAFISYIVFKKGKQAIWIQSMGWGKNGAPNFTDNQLRELAKSADARL